MRGAPPLLVFLVLATSAAVLCAGRATEEVAPHLRPFGKFCESLLKDAAQRSPTVRRMIGEIDLTDGLVVYLAVSPWTTTSATRLVSAVGPWRYLMVTLSLRKPRDEIVVRLGHELKHVLEIAQAPEVRDQPSIQELFERIGHGDRSEGQFETQAALDVGRQVRKELMAPPIPAGASTRTAAATGGLEIE